MSDDATNNFSNATHAGVNAAKQMGDKMSSLGTNAINEFSKMFAELKVPQMLDMEALMAAHRRNLETLSAANRVALEGAQAVARRNMEIMQQTMAELTEGMRHFSAAEPPQTRAVRQADMLKIAYERAVANMQEVGDLIQRSNGEALELLNKRFTESVDEVKGLLAKSQNPG